VSTDERLARLGLTHLKGDALLQALDALVASHAQKAEAFHAARVIQQEPMPTIIDELATVESTGPMVEAWLKLGGGAVQQVGGANAGSSAKVSKASAGLRSGATSRKVSAPTPEDEAALQKAKAAFAAKIVQLGLVAEVTALFSQAHKLPEPMRLLMLRSIDDARTAGEIKDIIAQMQPLFG
jgi:hypothetical protein